MQALCPPPKAPRAGCLHTCFISGILLHRHSPGNSRRGPPSCKRKCEPGVMYRCNAGDSPASIVGMPCGRCKTLIRPFMSAAKSRPPSVPSPSTPPSAPADPGGWSGRFSEPVTARVKRFTASVGFDQRMADVDIAGSLAHARMLAATGIIAASDLAAIEQRDGPDPGGDRRAASSPGRLDLEDVHLNIEDASPTLVGDAGKRLHTGRSRNDQVATDMRLWLRDGDRRPFGAADGAAVAPCWTWPSSMPTRSCRASRTCRPPSPSPSATTCWRTSRCSSATASGWSTAAGA